MTVRGIRTVMNEREMLVAIAVRSNGQMAYVRPWLNDRPLRLEGQIVSTRRVCALGQQHMLIHLCQADGTVITVDLGRSGPLRQSWLRSGPTVQVLARPIHVGGRRILLATRLYVNQQRHWLHQDWPNEGTWRERTTYYDQPGRYAMVNPDGTAIQQTRIGGRIIGVSMYMLEGGQHVLVTVVLDAGNKMTFDLGTLAEFDRDQMRIGSNVQVQVIPVSTASGRTLRATAVCVNDKVYPLSQQEEFKGE